jgi:hypothetical protein
MPPSRLEIFMFWTIGLIVAVASGAVAIYATAYHLW